IDGGIISGGILGSVVGGLFESMMKNQATETTQYTSWASQALSEVKKAQSWSEQLIKMQQEVQNTLNIVKMETQNLQSLKQYRWDGFAKGLHQLNAINNRLNGVYYGIDNLADAYEKLHEGYQNYAQDARSATSQLEYNRQQRQKLRELTNKNRATFQQTFEGLGIQAKDLESEVAIIQRLKQNSETADGNLKVIQAANDIALFQADQLRQLRITLMNQVNMLNQYLSSKNTEEERRQAEVEERDLKSD
ncbi:hypothetical protein CCZ01_09765, partial [Helicobacter monodelphidis]|uniref:hypothetical protein n=1 Tax=Helicobacter sp. 15-1451 TaxID=2004995 RepID=UPI000DCD8172